MVFRFHDFYFMLFFSCKYRAFEVYFGFDDWNEDIVVHLMIPFVRIFFGHEFRREAVENDE